MWFKSSAALRCINVGRKTRVACAGAQPYLSPRTISGNLMIDGVPDVRATKARPLNLSGKSTQQRSGDRNHTGAGRRHQVISIR